MNTISTFIGAFAGFILFYAIYKVKTGGFYKLSQAIINKAKQEAELFQQQGQKQLQETQKMQLEKFEAYLKKEKDFLITKERNLLEKESKLELRVSLAEEKLAQIEKKEIVLAKEKDLLKEREKAIEEEEIKIQQQVQTVGKLSEEEAKALIIKKVRNDLRKDCAKLTKNILNEARQKADKQACKIIVTAINRLAPSVPSDASIAVVTLQDEEMKKRIIGREGRNIKIFEKLCGVNLIVDDSPKTVLVSSFDPIRRHIGTQTLKELVADGRIHPSRIEEVVQKIEALTRTEIVEFGQKAAHEVGIYDLHPELIDWLGQLHFRYSLGQNVLSHSVEVAYIMGMIAEELGLNPFLARRIGLLHDIGKAASHTIKGTHALVGSKLAKKYQESEEVVNGIACHHNEISPITLEGSFCGAADAISGSRPGARSETVDQYMQRIQKLEELAQKMPYVEKAYAIYAGKELRVSLVAEHASDDDVINLARELTHKIEEELVYPGKIKVVVMREKRSIEYAI